MRKVLVTGGTGFLGGKLVQHLVSAGFLVRVLVRRTSNTELLRNIKVETVFGDVSDKDSVLNAVFGMEVVVHAAACTSGEDRDFEIVNIKGTQNVLESCEAHGIRKLVFISSCSVYGVSDYKRNEVITEESGLERFPWLRGKYSESKHRSEELVRKALTTKELPIVILRPGTIYGPGGELWSPMLGLSFRNKIYIVFGNGKFILPLVYVDNVVDAVMQSIACSNADNEIFNVVDSERVSKRSFIREIIKKIQPKAHVFYIPYWCLHYAILVQEWLFVIFRKTPILTVYRFVSSQKPVIYDASKINRILNWKPRVSFDEAVDKIMKKY
jgi:nucleoside-diphosphate-sugar epimerase